METWAQIGTVPGCQADWIACQSSFPQDITREWKWLLQETSRVNSDGKAIITAISGSKDLY